MTSHDTTLMYKYRNVNIEIDDCKKNLQLQYKDSFF